MTLPRTPLKAIQTETKEKMDLQSVIHRRDRVQAKVTRILNSVNAVPLPSISILKLYEKQLFDHYKEYDEFQNLICEEDSTNKANHETKFIEFESMFNKTYEIIHNAISVHETKVKMEESTRNIQPVMPSTSSTSVQQERVIIKQAPLQTPLPSFDGTISKFPRFIAIFEDIINRMTDCKATKLYHLDKCLIGKASGLIDEQMIDNSDYDGALKLLKERYQNQRLIIDTHIRGLFNLQRMSKENYTELRNLIDDVTRHIDALKYQKLELTGLSEMLVLNLLSAAIDSETRKHWETSFEKDKLPSYEAAIETLKERCNVLERCHVSSQSMEKHDNHTMKARNNKSDSKQMTYHSHTITESKFQCNFCGKQHSNYKCKKFLELNSRRRMFDVKERKLCFSCLRGGHIIANCRSSKRCKVCGKKHHTLLHQDSSNQKNLFSCSDEVVVNAKKLT